MKNRSFYPILAAGAAALMLTACSNDAGSDTSDTNTSASETTESSVSDVTAIIDDNPGRSRDVDGDGFVEDVTQAADDGSNADNIVKDAADGAEDIVDDAVTAVSDIADDLSPEEHDESTMTTTQSN